MENKNPYEELFNVNMTEGEAGYIFFANVDGKTPEELELLKEAYFKIDSAIYAKNVERVQITFK